MKKLVSRAFQKLKEADLVLFLVDVSEEPTMEIKHLYQRIQAYPHLVVFNKIDLIPNYLEEWRKTFFKYGEELIEISVREEVNLDLLAQRIYEKIVSKRATAVSEVMPNLRQKTSLEKAKRHLEDALKELQKGDLYLSLSL